MAPLLDEVAHVGEGLAALESHAAQQRGVAHPDPEPEAPARKLVNQARCLGEVARGARVEVRGVAQSSTRVSALMRQIDSSEWMSDPEVDRVETTQSGNSRQAEFVVYLRQESPGADDEEMLP